MEKEMLIDKYLKYSFTNDFQLNGRQIEPFESPKILGDLFESIIGAIFKDGGINEVLRVFKHMLSPFILYVAKYSK